MHPPPPPNWAPLPQIHGRREHGPAEYGEGTTLTATAEAISKEFGGTAPGPPAILKKHRSTAVSLAGSFAVVFFFLMPLVLLLWQCRLSECSAT